MTSKIMLTIGGVTLVCIAAALLFLKPTPTEQVEPVATSTPLQEDIAKANRNKSVSAPQSIPATTAPEPMKEELETEEEKSQRLIEEYGFNPENIESLRATRDGDPRAPEIAPHIPRELPTPEEVADPELYAKFEMRQRGKFITGYVASSKTKIEELQKFLDENREGIKPEDIQDIEEEIEELRKVRDRMIDEYPELLEEFGLLEESDVGAFSEESFDSE